MILGTHFLTTENLAFYHLIKKIKIFNNIKYALSNYEHGQTYLHSFIWIKIEKNKNKKKHTRKYIKIKVKGKKIGADLKINNIVEKDTRIKYIRTTSGRIIFNQTIKNYL